MQTFRAFVMVMDRVKTPAASYELAGFGPESARPAWVAIPLGPGWRGAIRVRQERPGTLTCWYDEQLSR